MQHRNIFFAALLLLLSTQLVGQNNTNSPYTRFGYGDLTEGTATELRGMGGVGIANRSKSTINALNPASYSSVDSLTFQFDVGAGARFSHFMTKGTDGNLSNSAFNANLEYLTMRFPLGRWLGFSAGLLPYSFSGYNFYQTDSLFVNRGTAEDERKVFYTRSFNGSGGFSQIYGGLSLNLFNHVSLGVNTYYMFGDVNNSRIVSYNPTIINASMETNRIHVSDLRVRYGLQFYNTLADKHDVVLGVIYENKTKFDGNFVRQLNNDTIDYTDGFELPQVLGVGLNYTFNKKLTVGFDYLQQNWGDALFFGKKDSLVNRTKLAFGAEYIPNPGGRRYSERIRYRVGFNTANQYYKINKLAPQNDYTFSFGVGLPTRTGKTMLNTSLEYGKIGSSSLLREDYLKVTFSASIDEHWFFKPKL